MAGEIVELERNPLRGGLVEFHVLYLYPVSPPIQVRGNTIPLTPRNELPPGVADYGVLGTPAVAETIMSKLDDGSLAFRVDRVKQRAGEPLPEVLARVRLRYPKGLVWLEEQRARYEHTGDKYDVT
jgi:hypothetical protein